MNLKFILLFTFLLVQIQASTIVCLKGTCSAGKSTLIRSIQEKDPHWVVVDEDQFVHQAYPLACALRFPEEYQIITRAIAKKIFTMRFGAQNCFLKKRSPKMIA